MKRIINTLERRPEPEVVEGFRKLLKIYSPSCVVADSMERAGVMHSSIKPLTDSRFVGVALTVKLYPGDLVDCLDALKVAGPGDLIVVDACGDTETSVWGGLMAGLCQQKGVVGAVVDGAIRDTDEIQALGFPICTRAVVPRSTHSPYSQRMEPIEVNVPITCGGVRVNPGDIVLVDEIGVVVVPQEEAREVLARAQAQAAQEEATRQRIKEGKTVEELLSEFGRL
ncbi:MAG TPA: orotidine 5-phosphate decarboxylase [Chloroflexi bacterium]|nr:orotidine 5-phosphate decarboxylase [Chloroflexota bacterium]